MGCSRYPKCKFRRALTPNGELPQPKLLEEACPNCGKPLQLRTGRYGEFVGCSGYPDCKYIKRDAAQAEAKLTGEKCPHVRRGQRSSSGPGATGRSSPALAIPNASTAPTSARTASRGQGPKVLDEPCPICGKPLMERRGRYGMFKSCSDYPKCPGPKGVAGRAQGAHPSKKTAGKAPKAETPVEA